MGQADYLIQGLFDYHRDLMGEAEGSRGVLYQMMLLMLLLTLEDRESGHSPAPVVCVRQCHDSPLLPCPPRQTHPAIPGPRCSFLEPSFALGSGKDTSLTLFTFPLPWDVLVLDPFGC